MFKTLMQCLAVVVVVVGGSGMASAQTRVQGGGASFPAPLYAKWTAEYNKANPEVKVDYQPSGSGGGIKGITDRVLHFAGSDAPLTADQEKKVPAPVLHIPTVAGPVVMIYNLPGLSGELKLNGEAVAGIFLGEIKTWDHAKIKTLNPTLNLPSKPIVVVHRSDGSGTSFIFTSYLSKVSKTWKDKVGAATSVDWPVGLGGKSNAGVAQNVQNTQGSIGYVESAFAVSNRLPYAAQINKAGKEVKASIEGVEAAAASLKEIPADLKVDITDAEGEAAYPIAGYTYMLVYQDVSYLKNKALAENVLKYVNWCITDGQSMAKDLGYAKLPAEMGAKVSAKLKTVTFDGQALLK